MIDELISQEHLNIIVDTLLRRSRQILALEQNRRALEYAPYCSMRRKHNTTSLMLSAFAPDQFKCEGIRVDNVSYGLNGRMAQPELRVDVAIVQIYSNGSNLKGNVINDRCERYNSSEESRPQFLIIVVTMSSEGNISRIDLRRPDRSTTIIETKTVYTNITKISSAM